jgi:hypothetical protein
MSDIDTTPGFFGKIKKDPIPAIGELNLQYKILSMIVKEIKFFNIIRNEWLFRSSGLRGI